jgi:hypothetical protein
MGIPRGVCWKGHWEALPRMGYERVRGLVLVQRVVRGCSAAGWTLRQ